jgi:hypothetical protein
MCLVSIGIVIMTDSNYNFFNDPSNFIYVAIIIPLLEILYRIFQSISKLGRFWKRQPADPQKSFPMTLKLDNYLTQNLNIFQGCLIRGVYFEQFHLQEKGLPY